MNTKQNLMSEVNRTLRLRSKGTPQSRLEKRRIMRAIIKDLLDLRIAPPSFKKLESNHIRQCVEHWQQKGNSTATIKNKLSVLRALNQLGQFDISIPVNLELGVSSQNSAKANKPGLADININDLYQQLHHPISKLLFNLQLYFGLTLTEAIHLNPKLAVDNATLTIHRHIAFNRKERFIDIFSSEQHAALERLRTLLGASACLARLSSEKHIVQLYQAELSLISNAKGLCLKEHFLIGYIAKFKAKHIDHDKMILLLADQTGYSKKYIRYQLIGKGQL